MLWQVDPTSSTPLFEQLASAVRRAVAEDALHRGDRLPSAKQLAESLEINLHTVLRAYQVLRDEGLIELRRGRGAVVTAERPDAGRLAHLVDELVREGARLGLGADELARMVKEKS